MPLQRSNRADNPAVKGIARLPTYLVVSILVVLVTAVGFVAARSGPEREPVSAGADEIAETATPLPTPVPLETGSPLPTPVPPMEQGAVVDTAVTWWGAWLPDEVTDALDEALTEARRSRSSTPTSPGDGPGASTASASPSPSPSPEPAADDPLLPVPEVTAVPLPLSTPLPTLAPLPGAIPPLPLSPPTQTVPPLLP